MNAEPDRGISTDELTGACGLSGAALRKAMSDLETLGIASDDTAVTIFVNVGVEDSSLRRLEQAARLEADLVALLREAGDEAYRARHHRPSWEVVLPELVYGHPTASDDAQKRPWV